MPGAADLLEAERISVIAERSGFASHEVFTRAFTRTFGLSPRAYRARGLHVDDHRTAAVHAATVQSTAPCVGLYRLTTAGRSTAVPMRPRTTNSARPWCGACCLG